MQTLNFNIRDHENTIELLRNEIENYIKAEANMKGTIDKSK